MWPNPQKIAGLVTFTEEIPDRKIHFLCNVYCHCNKMMKTNGRKLELVLKVQRNSIDGTNASKIK